MSRIKGLLTRVREKSHKIVYQKNLNFLREQPDFRQNSYIVCLNQVQDDIVFVSKFGQKNKERSTEYIILFLSVSNIEDLFLNINYCYIIQ